MKKVAVALLCMVSLIAVDVSAKAKKEKAPKAPKVKKAKGGKGAGGTPYVIKDGDGVVGYYTFDEEIEDNELVDMSGTGHNVSTAALDGSVLTEGKNGKALQFNGEDEYITLDESLLSGDGFTVALWVKAASWAVWGRMFDFGDTKTDVFVAVDGRTPGTLGMREEGTESQVNCPLPPQGKWVHVAATFGGGKMALYVNGKQSQELDCPVEVSQLAAGDPLGLYVGRSNWAADPMFNGAIDDLLVASRSFSADEIAAVCAGVTPPAAQ